MAAAISAFGAAPETRPWNADIIYFALTDRFYDGDPSNNVPKGSDPTLYDRAQTNIDRYHGGDFRGLEVALRDGYFDALGVTALWITPPVRNVWYSAFDLHDAPKTGYHGYWAQDFLDIDPHLVSARSLEGDRAYPDNRDGRMQHYKDLVDLAHRHGIKVIQDIVCHHAGPVFYYDANGNGQFDRDQKGEWIQPYKHDGPYSDAAWAETPEWNQQKVFPGGPMTVLGKEIRLAGALAKLTSYGRRGMSADSLGKSDGEELECDFFGLRSYDTNPASATFNDLVNDFVEIYAFYVETVGVDGFRIDTVKHVHPEFWDAFSERLRKRLGPEKSRGLLLFGEVYDGNARKAGEYTYRRDWPRTLGPSLDSVLDFSFCFAARSFLRAGDHPFGPTRPLAGVLGEALAGPGTKKERPFYNPTPGLDGLNSAQKVVKFVENHDGLNRFRVQGVSEQRNLLANALLLLSPGIPCLYYGSEAGLQDTRGKVGPDTETGRLSFIPAGRATPFSAPRSTRSFAAISKLCELRRSLPALTHGTSSILRPAESTNRDDGVLGFARGGDEGVPPLIVVIHAGAEQGAAGGSTSSMVLVSSNGKPLLRPGEQLDRLHVEGLDLPGQAGMTSVVRWENEVPIGSFQTGAESVNLYRVIPSSK